MTRARRELALISYPMASQLAVKVTEAREGDTLTIGGRKIAGGAGRLCLSGLCLRESGGACALRRRSGIACAACLRALR